MILHKTAGDVTVATAILLYSLWLTHINHDEEPNLIFALHHTVYMNMIVKVYLNSQSSPDNNNHGFSPKESNFAQSSIHGENTTTPNTKA